MSDPWGDLLGQYENLRRIVDNAARKSEPDFHEAVERVRSVLQANRAKWITQDGIVKRTGLSQRAVVAALDALKDRGRTKSGARRDGSRVWRAT